MIPKCLRDRGIERSELELLVGSRRLELPRLGADVPAIHGARGIQVRLCDAELGLGRAQPRLCLRDIGARQFTDLKAVVGGAKLLVQRLHVLLLQLHDRGIADDVHVCSNGTEEYVLFGVAQRFARGEHLALCGADQVAGLEAVEDILLRGDTVAARIIVRAVDRRRRSLCPGAVDIGLRVAEYFRTIAGERLRHEFVGHAHGGALRIDRRIREIGIDQRLLEGLRMQRGRRGGQNADGAGSTGGARIFQLHKRHTHPRLPSVAAVAGFPDLARTIVDGMRFANSHRTQVSLSRAGAAPPQHRKALNPAFRCGNVRKRTSPPLRNREEEELPRRTDAGRSHARLSGRRA